MNKKLMGIVGILFISLMLSSISIAKDDKPIVFSINEDGTKFTIKNAGTDPVFVSDKLYTVDNQNNIVNTVQNYPTDTVLKISPGVSYSWEVDDPVKEGDKGKIFWGTNKNSLTSTYTDKFTFPPFPKMALVKFYTDKTVYNKGQNVELIMKNIGKVPVYVPVTDPWIIKNMRRITVAHIDVCGSGYGTECSYTTLDPGEEISHFWNQKDDNGIQVNTGVYKAYARYTKDNPATVPTPKMETKSRVFLIR